MTRQQAEPEQHDIRHLGQWIGEALGQGLSDGLHEAIAASELDLSPFVEVVLNVLRQEALAAGAAVAQAAAEEETPSEADEQLAAVARNESYRPCEEEGCTEPAIARNLCRRHYARKLYQERKERLGARGYRVIQPPTQYGFGGSPVAEKKPLAPVGPIIRRKRTEDPEAPASVAAAAASAPPPPAMLKPLTSAAPIEIAPSPIAAAAAAAGVTVESVARFLMGGGKS